MHLPIKTQPTNTRSIVTRAFCLFLLFLVCTGAFAQPSSSTQLSSSTQPPPGDFDADDIEIVQGEDKVVYEYRRNGILMMIKVVPKKGKPYYMVPPGGAHYEDLDHQKSLYPQWRLIEW